MNTPPYITIEGVIGVGKTTLARYLSDAVQAETLLEVFEENPFLSAFYGDRERYAFQTQIFFLLSRYRQQHQVVPGLLGKTALVSDYLFAKDYLFAGLNLTGDELVVYSNVYHALAERIPTPNLVVYLRADVNTLMERIAIRDRSYERDMDRGYIEALAHAYDTFFEDYTEAPTLIINTDALNIVHDLTARQALIGQIKRAIEDGARQPYLPQMGDTRPPLDAIFAPNNARRLPDFQQFHQALDREKNFTSDLYLNYLKLSEEMGELATELAKVWQSARAAPNQSPAEAQQQALNTHRTALRQELADVLAYLIKLANYTGIDLEAAYLEKMDKNLNRDWRWGVEQ